MTLKHPKENYRKPGSNVGLRNLLSPLYQHGWILIRYLNRLPDPPEQVIPPTAPEEGSEEVIIEPTPPETGETTTPVEGEESGTP